MDLLPGDLESEILRAARRVLDQQCPMSAVRTTAESGNGIIEGLWARAADQGWFGLSVPDSSGGAGLSLVEDMVLFEELGRHLAPGPFIATVASAHVLAGTEFAERLLRGEAVALGTDTRDTEGLRAEGDRLYGRLPRVHHGVDDIPLLCEVDGELWWVEGAAFEPYSCIDATMRIASAHLDGIRGKPTGIPSDPLRETVDLLASAMAVGVADAALNLATRYATERQQFGQPIGSFQAVKHKLAESAVRVEMARSLVAMAAVERRDLASAATVREARLLAADYAVENGSTCILVHGAMGWTIECDAQWFLRRARYLQQYRTGPDELSHEIVVSAGERKGGFD